MLVLAKNKKKQKIKRLNHPRTESRIRSPANMLLVSQPDISTRQEEKRRTIIDFMERHT